MSSTGLKDLRAQARQPEVTVLGIQERVERSQQVSVPVLALQQLAETTAPLPVVDRADPERTRDFVICSPVIADVHQLLGAQPELVQHDGPQAVRLVHAVRVRAEHAHALQRLEFRPGQQVGQLVLGEVGVGHQHDRNALLARQVRDRSDVQVHDRQRVFELDLGLHKLLKLHPAEQAQWHPPPDVEQRDLAAQRTAATARLPLGVDAHASECGVA